LIALIANARRSPAHSRTPGDLAIARFPKRPANSTRQSTGPLPVQGVGTALDF